MLWLWFLLRFAKAINKRLLYTHRYGILSILILLTIITQSIPFELRVLADESNILSVSRSMFDSKETLNSISGQEYYDNYHSTHDVIPIRPPLFAFLVHISHSIFGYTPENAGRVNLVILGALLFLVYSCVQRYRGQTYGIIAVILLVSSPILVLCTRSAGFDLLSVLLLAQLFHAIRRYDNCQNRKRLWWVWICLLLFCYARYENLILIAITLAYLFLRHMRYIRPHLPTMATLGTLFLLPRWFQMRLSAGQYENEEESLLSISHLLSNISRFFTSLIDFNFVIPYNTLLNILGLCSALWILYECFQKIRSRRVLLELSTVALLCTVFFAHFLGDYQNHTSLRFYLLLNDSLPKENFLLSR
jgi:4-amino-4-deoxy-L-arabinose transferase-like glycosyltransferase